MDCSAPAQLATFWAGILGGQPVERSAEWAFVDPPGWTRLAFQRVPESKLTKNRLHIDVSVDDVVAATEAAERLGSNSGRHCPGGPGRHLSGAAGSRGKRVVRRPKCRKVIYAPATVSRAQR
ncbi:VOC family protein [Rhodococcus sp. no. 34]